MVSDSKIRANRANARASTGPKTALGRVRAAKNALRHGLSLPIHTDPALCEEVENLGREIAGPDANMEIQELARRVAETQIDVRRARCARHRFLSARMDDPYYEPRAETRTKWKFLMKLLGSRAPDISMEDLLRYLLTTPQGPCKFATILTEDTKQLLAIDRYERRALSRRKFAIRALDEVHRRRLSSGRNR